MGYLLTAYYFYSTDKYVKKHQLLPSTISISEGIRSNRCDKREDDDIKRDEKKRGMRSNRHWVLCGDQIDKKSYYAWIHPWIQTMMSWLIDNPHSHRYDIDWTTPSCVLVLRAIAFAFDFYDGGELKNPKQTAEEKENAILAPPSLIDVLAFFFFPCSLIAGPQFTFRRFFLVCFLLLMLMHRRVLTSYPSARYEKYVNNQLLTIPTATQGSFHFVLRSCLIVLWTSWRSDIDDIIEDEGRYSSLIRSIPIGTVAGRLLLGAVYLGEFYFQ